MNKNYLLILLAKKLNKRSKKISATSKYTYNLKIDRVEPAKLKIKNMSLKVQVKLPKKVDLRSKFPPIYDQGSLGSCTANALCGVIGFENPSIVGSRLFLYYNERMLDNNIATDSGAYLHDGIESLQKHGICQEVEWGYDIAKFTEKPSEQCYINALEHTASQVLNISNNMLQMKICLANNDPFVVGIAVYSSFESIKVAKTGIVPMPSRYDQLLGGHAVVCVGYDDSKQSWIMRNSWSTRWGDKGYFYLPYAYLLNPLLSSDLWCIQKIK